MPNNTNSNNNNNNIKHNIASADNSLPPPPPPLFACPHCPKVFGKPVKLERHLQVHHSHLTTLSIPSDILVQQQQQEGQREAGEERRQDEPHQVEGHHSNDKENRKKKHIYSGIAFRSVASQLAVPAVSVPVEVGNTLVAALAQANLAFDAGHRLCLLCADDSNNKARTFASRKDLAAHIVAKHSTNLTTTTTAVDNNNGTDNCDPQHRLNRDSLSNKMRAASTLSPPQSMASSFGTVQSMTPSPPQAASTVVKSSTTPLLNQNKKRARDFSDDNNNDGSDQGKRASHVEHDDGLDEIQPGPVTKRVKLEVSVPSSGTKPPITPKKARPVVAPKTQALAEAARLNANNNNNNNASSSSLKKESLKTNSSSRSAAQSPARISFSPTTKLGSAAPAKNGTGKGDGVNNTGITTAGREQAKNTTTTPANGNPGSDTANNNKNNNKSQVLDFSAMVGIFTNSHKSYYRLVDP